MDPQLPEATPTTHPVLGQIPAGKPEVPVKEAVGKWLLLGCASTLATLLAVGGWLLWALWASGSTR